MLWLSYLAMFLLLLVGALLIFIILLQRGRGGGLAGALGGMGGQSAFGTKAGDMFTRITVVLALIWIVLCAGQIPLARAVAKRYTGGGDANDMLQSAPIKGAGASTKLDLPPLGDGEKKATDEVKAEDESTSAVTTETKTPAADTEKSAEKPSEEAKTEAPAEGAAKSDPAADTKEAQADKPAAADEKTEAEKKSDAEPDKQP